MINRKNTKSTKILTPLNTQKKKNTKTPKTLKA